MNRLRTMPTPPSAGDDVKAAEKPVSADDLVRATVEGIRQYLMKFLIQRVGDHDAAADVLQCFYVTILSRISDLRETENLRPWMRRILETTLIHYYWEQRRKRRTEAKLRATDLRQIEGEGANDFDAAVCICLYMLLPTLKREYADILLCVDLRSEEKSDTTAAELGLTESNFRVRLHRARKALKLRLEETCRTWAVHGFLHCARGYAGRVRVDLARRRALAGP